LNGGLLLPRQRLLSAGLALASWLTIAPVADAADPASSSPEARAVRYLAREVPRWSRENSCFSCHNNGDAARALIRAERAGIPVPRNALDETIAWISHPDGWDRNGGQGPFNDKRLARIVFTATLKSAAEARHNVKRAALISAAERLAADQARDGSWKVEGEDGLGSPASYGRTLATLMARDSLRAAGPERFRDAIRKADAWLLGRVPKGVFDAAISLWASSSAAEGSGPIAERRLRALDFIRRGRSDEGGWGPFVSSPPEVFDTAIVLLALNATKPPGDEIQGLIRNGRAYLIANQRADGGWTETTRPSGSESYAQHISTTGWALLALLETRAEE
jgi:hypothetical protein